MYLFSSHLSLLRLILGALVLTLVSVTLAMLVLCIGRQESAVSMRE